MAPATTNDAGRNANARGRFITFEGGEGAGKSTQVLKLRDRLVERGIDVIVTREPGGTPGAEAIRALLVKGDTGRWEPISEALLHFAARTEHVKKIIQPALGAGTWVICDRFADSTMAYQGYGQGLGPEVIKRLYDITLGSLKPDLTFMLDLPEGMGLARAAGRDVTTALGGQEDRYERMGTPFHARLRQAFLDIAAAEPKRCQVLDSSADKQEVARQIWATVTARLGI
jgi:dTMP kinase